MGNREEARMAGGLEIAKVNADVYTTTRKAPNRPTPTRDAPHLDFHLMPLLHFLHFSILVPELGLFVLELLLRNLPEGVDFVLRSTIHTHTQSGKRGERG